MVIPKEGKDLSKPENYRPITIMNHDYKVFMALLVNRLARHLNSVIHPDQTGFMRGRGTHDNIARVLMTLDEADRTGQKVLMMALDAEKAFDRVEWDFMFQVMKEVGIPKKFSSSVFRIYSQAEATVKVGGKLVTLSQ